MNFQRTVRCVLTICLTRGGSSIQSLLQIWSRTECGSELALAGEFA
jgi:hypothetical protein